jgi:hypothetical protein
MDDMYGLTLMECGKLPTSCSKKVKSFSLSVLTDSTAIIHLSCSFRILLKIQSILPTSVQASFDAPGDDVDEL